MEGDGILIEENLPLGEHTYEITVDGVRTHCTIAVLPPMEALLAKRCQFIAQKQQYHNPNSPLDGAYLIYDNEEEHLFYSPEPDFNGGRERVGMGVLLARYLQTHPDSAMQESLEKYVRYVVWELVGTKTGQVFHDYGRDETYKRLYNYPWFSRLFCELHSLYGDKRCMDVAYRVMKRFYDEGGAHFYAIEIPVPELLAGLRAENMAEEEAALMDCFRAHGRFIMETGLLYPPHEVHYEQSIVAPAADLLLKLYEATGEKRYLTEAEVHLHALELFNGFQPDCHLYETAIRHWDGYWFGKRRLYGDTFPHYWSALTGRVFRHYGKLTGNEKYLRRSGHSLRGGDDV